MLRDILNIGASKKHVKELITPHKICVAILIRQFCLFRESSQNTEGSQFRLLPSAMPPAHRKDFCILILKLIQSPDLTLAELRGLLLSGKYKIDQRFITKFDIALRDLYTVGVNNLLDLAEYISRLTIDLHLNGIWCQVNKNSILGCYLRRLMVFFDKLSFSEVTTVYESFKEYYKPCEQDIRSRKKFLTKADVENAEMQTAAEISRIQPISLYGKANHWSKRQAELFIATQSALISNNETGAQSPVELSEHINTLLKSNPDLAEAHFLSYMNYLRVKEFCGAMESLYHSFDRSTPNNDGKNNNEEKHKGFRYAALNLAVLHYHFGHKDEALQALKESVRMAHEATDNICLQHALTWMYKLSNTNKEMLMQHSILKSKNLNLTYIASLGVQSYAQHLGLAGLTPKYIFEMMVKSDILNCQNTYRDLMSSSYSQKASLWLLYGKTEMSSLWSQLLLHLNSDCLSYGKIFNGEGTCQAICHMANILLLDGEYRQSSIVLNLARKKFPNEPICHNWMLCESLFTFVRALHNGDWTTAEVSASQMAAIDKWESCLRMAELHIAKGDFQSAHVCIYKVLDICENDPDAKLEINCKVRAVILLSDLHCSNAVFNIPTNIITALNSALSTANLYHLEYLASILHMHLANIQLLMGLPSQALKILDKNLVQMLTHGGKFDAARAMLLYVKCIVADAGLNPQVDRYSVILQATEILKKVKDDFHKVEARARVKDVLFLQAQLYNEIEHLEDRNDCALEYKQYQHDYSTKNSRSLLFSF